MIGYIHSFQSLGAVDGPGVRFVVFMQGCPLRCGCCHNPDTWDIGRGREFTPEQVLQKVLRYREYFGDDGGITVSGGEPLLQAAFVKELFSLCKEQGIHTCLDTSGAVRNADVEALLDVTDRVLLDVKYTSDEQYHRYVGCSYQTVLGFLQRLNERKIATTLRQVVLPSLNDNRETMERLVELRRAHSCVDEIELLPFHKLCREKYDRLGIPFPFAHISEPSAESVSELREFLEVNV